MGSVAAYRGDHPVAEKLPPRTLVWKTCWYGPGGAGAWLLFGWMACLPMLFVMGLAFQVVTLALGETRDAEIVDVSVETGAKGWRYQRVRFRHEVGGQPVYGERHVAYGSDGRLPPGLAASAGEQTTVSCFAQGSIHRDDLALPRESAFHRRATDVAASFFATLAAGGFIGFLWFVSLRIARRERALFREGVLATGRVDALRTFPGKRKHSDRRVLVYTFEGPDGLPRTGKCEARDPAAYAALAEGDVVHVLYDPRDWRESQVYETGAYAFGSVDDRPRLRGGA